MLMEHMKRLMLLGMVMMIPNGCAGMPDRSPLVVDVPISGTERDAVHSLALDDGDYVEGTLDSGTDAADLRLIDTEGRPIRLLLNGTAGREVFRFVAGPGMAALRVTLRGAGGYRLALTRRIAVADQRPVPPGHLSPTIAALAETVTRGGGTEAFWQDMARRGTPLIEPVTDAAESERVTMTFLARGARRNVRLLGGPNSRHENLERLGGSDVWFKSYVVPAATRLSYQIAPDVPDVPGTCRECRMAILSQLQADPLNHRPWPVDAPDRYNQVSLVELPGAPPQPGLEGGWAEPAGRLVGERFASRILGNTRDIALYTPPGVDPKGKDTVLLLLFDGPDYLDRQAPVPTMLDRLTGDGRLPPTVAVFIANPTSEARERELPANPAFAAMLADELLPWLGERMGIRFRPDRTVLAGSSYGGLAAVSAALAHPDRFGNALSLSGSFWWHPADAPPDRPEHMAGLVASRERRPVRFFLSAGLFEGGSDGDIGILESSRHLRDVLEAKGYEVTYRDYAAGHDRFAWRGALGDGLMALFGH
ncbi:enterochelin esterase family protein [Azospirillum brasilense]|uniref:Enterochelin esterase family protein n=1 Tax=Azospirillum brasilense TaxID=192 RepID=A0A560CKY6_AZOBR|nr:alpha/beta hydrolase-fold protein [Azospirillum brasilense]TWA85534.1 enterochelin esterase family protein [Azospirillum brasilense]